MAKLDLEFGKRLLNETEASQSPLATEQLSAQSLSIDAPSQANHLQDILEAEMALQNASFAHEYAMMEMEVASLYSEQREIEGRLDNARQTYFQARAFLLGQAPYRLEKLEAELREQKQNFRTHQA